MISVLRVCPGLLRGVFLALLLLAPGWAQTVAVTPSATTYAPAGGTIAFTVVMTYPEATAVGFLVGAVPAGWSLGTVAGANPPPIAPPVGTTDAFEFAYINIPTGGASFTFTANHPAGLVGNQTFAAISANFRFGTSSPANVTVAPIVLTSTSTAAVPPSILTLPVGASLSQGQNYTLWVAATGSTPLTFQWRRNGTAIPGATASSLVLTNVTTAVAGSYAVDVTNFAGGVSTAGTPAVVEVKAPVAPVITTQPRAVSADVGGNSLMTVGATGTAPLTYQWRKDGTALVGAVNETLTLVNVQLTSAGSYTVVVTNAGGSVTSTAATLTVKPVVTAVVPQITTQPVGQTVAAGASVFVSVAASGTAPLTYQWRKDGVAIAGATAATLLLPGATAAAAGSYTVVVSNAAGSVTSGAAQLTVRSATGIAGTYVGTFGGGGGSFALLVRPDRSGVFVGFAAAARAAVVNRNVAIDSAGQFSAAEPAGTAPRAQGEGEPARAAQEGAYRIDGRIAADGTLSGAVPALNLTFAAPGAQQTGTTSGVAGFYQAGVAGGSAVSYAMLSPAGEAVVVAILGSTAEGGRGTVDARGTFAVTTASGGRFTGEVRTDYAVTTTYVPATAGASVIFQGANAEARSDVEKLVNISTRSRIGGGGEALVAGFVLAGSVAKPVLVRAIGPTLTGFGVAGALAAARLEVYRGATSVAVANNWGDGASDTNDIVDASQRVGAFPLDRTSRDAALLLALTPGAYTAVVTGQAGETGVALVEVYDATVGPIPRAQRIINIATRSRAGAGDEILIAGFFVAGTLPKRVLVRGAGPALTQFGVTGVLARPELAVYSGSTVLARNAGWSDSPEVAALGTAAAQAGAFAFPVGSADAALILNLAPGSYTAQLGGAAGSAGNALIEIYELP